MACDLLALVAICSECGNSNEKRRGVSSGEPATPMQVMQAVHRLR